MKKLNSLILAGISASVVLLTSVSTNAQVSVTVDGNGNVTSSSPFGSFLASGVVASNPWIGSATVLQYDYSTAYPQSSLVPVEGQVDIFSSSTYIPANLVAVVAFLPDGPSYLDFMSLVVPSSEAYVTSIPTFSPSLSLVADITEGMCGITTYTAVGPNGPNATPGFMDDGGSPIVYTFDVPTTYCAPDGGTTVGLLGLGLVGLGVLKRKLGRN